MRRWAELKITMPRVTLVTLSDTCIRHRTMAALHEDRLIHRRKKRPDSRSSVRQRPSSPEVLGPSKSSKTSRHNSGSADLSPARRGRQKTPDFCPLRWSSTSGATSAGLVTAEVMRDEILKARREREKFFKEMDSELSGSMAKTVYRKDGVRLNLRLETLRKRKEEMKKAEEDERFMQWGRG